jgi:hypothetical protein
MPTSFGGREREVQLAKLAFTSAMKGSATVSALRRMPLGAGVGAGSGPVSAIAVGDVDSENRAMIHPEDDFLQSDKKIEISRNGEYAVCQRQCEAL